jgi:hypothetical protein
MSKTQKDMFTREEAVEFLQNSWKIKNVLKRMKTDRKNLADEIATQILAKVPFQSLSLVAARPEDRNRPSFEDIKARCTTGANICNSPFEISPPYNAICLTLHFLLFE